MHINTGVYNFASIIWRDGGSVHPVTSPSESRSARAIALVAVDAVMTVAGSGHPGIREGRARDSTLCDPNGLAVDANRFTNYL